MATCANTWEIKNYLNVLFEFFDDAGDGLDVAFSGASCKRLLLAKSHESPEDSRDVLLDAEGLLKEESYGAVLLLSLSSS